MKTYRCWMYDLVSMKFNRNVDLIELEIKYRTKDDYIIDNEGGEDIKFYEKDNKYFESASGQEIKALFDIGGQFCVRLIPVLE